MVVKHKTLECVLDLLVGAFSIVGKHSQPCTYKPIHKVGLSNKVGLLVRRCVGHYLVDK